MKLIEFTDKGLYCAAGDFYIDPWKPVKKAIITHAHSDHARPGNKHYLCHYLTKPLLQARLGDNDYQSIEWNEFLLINGVKISLHPAGHIIGSSQIRVEHNNEIWVVSGDYKTENDGISGRFEPVPCNVFITESTFGLPIYNWAAQENIYTHIRNWILNNKENGKTSVLIAYSLGKAQRLLKAIGPLQEKIYVHGAIWNMHQALSSAGILLPEVERITPDTSKETLKKSIVIAPPGADGSSWMKRMEPYATGVCSGWMQVRGNVRRRNADAGFVLSDHADWKGLLSAVKATGAEKVFVTHGFQSTFSRYLNENGIASAEVKTEYGNDDEEPANDAGFVESVPDIDEQNTQEKL
ncbi:ligase-associated DNA damage response exonuclease [Panacibacter ginsenosidivorans]|uniref:Ligase-associated DNA damage response exonuclease n=1 Tax=Panacibacter ginsenosidivorans TaxID=1813871 RepID=A0A5B8VEU8_9BACT|nr:ligase-associated DNA damage response exonuclease [Panacibacter ginsenosidivorans]QEC69960.1 ligase-associated DNA damage response exonuclease [Panacibacter ginsenosidivorans]